MRIWDLHCHLAGFKGDTPEERMARMIAYADRMGVERLCVYMGMSFLHDPKPDDLRRQNDEVLRAISHHHDRAFGFAYVSPNHVEESLAEIDRLIANGPMVGIKLWVARRCDDPAIDPIIRRAAELKAVIFQHTYFKAGGNLPGESTPDDLVALASRFSKVPLICGHSGADWERGLRAVRAYPNIHVELAGSDPTAGFVEMAVRELGARRVLYGSDVGGRSFASQLAKVTGAEIADEDRRLILAENLRRLLAPILRDKGIAP